MDYKIQTIVFPKEERHLTCKELFYRGEGGYYDKDEKVFCFGYGQVCDLLTYLNACSWRKWKRFTKADNISLHLTVEGPCAVTFAGKSLELLEEKRTDYREIKDLNTGKREISFDYPDNDEVMLGAVITALGDVKIHDAFFTVKCEEKDLNYVRLSLATTTFKKEAFITKTVKLLKEEIIGSSDDIKGNFEVHVVDNGNTLKKEEIEGEDVFLHPNPNTGGSGGFARGMYETLHLEKPATHILLMDDDILVLPESIKRTYNLLRFLKPEYKGYNINGAMLRYEIPYKQYEDVGTLSQGELFKSLKPKYDHRNVVESLRNDSLYFNNENVYGAWWYCCIPIETVKTNGYPLPLFVRGDDVEYSFRCKAKFITMNGICIWHMGFFDKFNGAMNVYQQFRNLHIAQASKPGLFNGIDIHRLYCSSFENDLKKFNYSTCEQYLAGFEDFLKGPEFIENCDGEQLIREQSANNEKYVPITDYPELQIFDLTDCFNDEPRAAVPMAIARLHWRFTWNGHTALKKPNNANLPVAAFDYTMPLSKMAGVRRYAAVNPFSETVAIRERDVARFKTIIKKYKALEKEYKKCRPQLEQKYAEKYAYLTGEEFWVKKLGLN